MRPWIGVDLDGTLARYETFVSPTHIGEPIPLMVERVKAWLKAGVQVKIMTARVYAPSLTDNVSELEFHKRNREARLARKAIEEWCALHIGYTLEVTCTKDYGMLELYDDRAVQVEKNTGRLVGYTTRATT
jgi:hypothetical protein